MEREFYHRLMYTVAAIWNWILAITFLTLPRINPEFFEISGNVLPPTLLWFDCFMGLVFAFGWGFYFISKDSSQNHGLVMIAIFEKCWVFVIGFYYFLVVQASIWVFLVVLGDLIFGLLFLEDLWSIRRKN